MDESTDGGVYSCLRAGWIVRKSAFVGFYGVLTGYLKLNSRHECHCVLLSKRSSKWSFLQAVEARARKDFFHLSFPFSGVSHEWLKSFAAVVPSSDLRVAVEHLPVSSSIMMRAISVM